MWRNRELETKCNIGSRSTVHRGIESARTNVQEQLVAFLHDWLFWVAAESYQASGGVGASEFGETIALADRIPVEHSGAASSR